GNDNNGTFGICVVEIENIIPECGDTFYDSGGPSGNYGNNENRITTIYPNIPGGIVMATFTAFELENTWDYLYVHDGPDTSSPLIRSLTGTTIPAPITSTHPTGALTFRFTSDSSGYYRGWAAVISCDSSCDLTISETPNPVGADDCSLIYNQLVATSRANIPTKNVFSEIFNSNDFPAGWMVSNETNNTQWIISNTDESGGTANEAMLDWISGSSDTGNWSLTSP